MPPGSTSTSDKDQIKVWRRITIIVTQKLGVEPSQGIDNLT